ncbi:MAG: hypothetical protein GTN35_05280 [Nitrososphaeria archaeon]|nr:hypothetical protein [Nitrosopumilaceae archaeon]NIP09605.1 hypothetical protein [Nitrosopumilaceae archaeon]NIP91788.1 hypothetical protein [Nitrososphaeria archaeon]NIS95847.1 hypothetical protein [Nitrosopumilaceae archaeon]
MKKLLFLLPLLVVGMGVAYAEPFTNIQTSVLDYSNNTATIQITWNADESVSSYQIGCVSCFPNTAESTSENSIIVSNVTPFPNSTIAMLYGIAYDVENQIMTAKQIIVNLVQ